MSKYIPKNINNPLSKGLVAKYKHVDKTHYDKKEENTKFKVGYGDNKSVSYMSNKALLLRKQQKTCIGTMKVHYSISIRPDNLDNAAKIVLRVCSREQYSDLPIVFKFITPCNKFMREGAALTFHINGIKISNEKKNEAKEIIEESWYSLFKEIDDAFIKGSIESSKKAITDKEISGTRYATYRLGLCFGINIEQIDFEKEHEVFDVAGNYITHLRYDNTAEHYDPYNLKEKGCDIIENCITRRTIDMAKEYFSEDSESIKSSLSKHLSNNKRAKELILYYDKDKEFSDQDLLNCPNSLESPELIEALFEALQGSEIESVTLSLNDINDETVGKLKLLNQTNIRTIHLVETYDSEFQCDEEKLREALKDTYISSVTGIDATYIDDILKENGKKLIKRDKDLDQKDIEREEKSWVQKMLSSKFGKQKSKDGWHEI